MRRLSFFSLTVGMLMIVMNGCSVKEERGVCPCRLFLDMTDVEMSLMSPLLLYVASDDGLEHKAVLDQDSFSIYETYVPRKELRITSWSGTEGFVSEKGLSIPLGYDCPPVYIHSSCVSAQGESVRDTVCMRKNHCVLTVKFVNAEEFYMMTIRGDVSGFDAQGNPKEGEFRVHCDMDSLPMTSTQVCLPRQMGGPLYLDITDIHGKVKSFPLREYILGAGYDWAEADLKDLSLTLNYTLTSVSLVILGWDEEFVFDVVI